MNIILSKIEFQGFLPGRASFARISIMFLIGAICLQSHAQVDQRVALGDKYFAAGEYYTAANLYEQFLNPSKKQVVKTGFPLTSKRGGNVVGYGDKMEVLYKQAESYRLANYFKTAAEKYKACIDKDGARFPDASYWLAVCQRGLGNYDAAEESIKKYLGNTSLEEAKQDQAKKELATIQFIRDQKKQPDTALYKLSKINGINNDSKGLYAMVNAGDNQFVFTSTATDSNIINGVNPYHCRLFFATMEKGNLVNIVPANIEGEDRNLNQGSACTSPDGKRLYLTQWKKENGRNISSIFMSEKTGTGWNAPLLLGAINKQGFSSKQPFCSADGKTLYFSSDMPGGLGGFDIWSASIQADGTTSTPVNTGSVINTAEDEQAPFYQVSNAELVFSSNGRLGMGGFDLFVSKRAGDDWGTPENLGYPVNSSRDDIYFQTSEDKEFYKDAIISSDRGSECCLETYAVTKATRKKKMEGSISDCSKHAPIANAQVIMTDASGRTWKTTSADDGTFSFDITDDPKQNTIVVTKQQFGAKSGQVSIEKTTQPDIQTQLLQNAVICLDTIEEKTMVIKAENVVTVYFDFDKSDLKERGVSLLDSVADVLTKDITATVQISGYTDGLGSDAYNKKLSDRRARACADFLLSKGVDTTRISFESFGACCPVEMEKINGRDNPDGRSKNRRAMINISKQ